MRSEGRSSGVGTSWLPRTAKPQGALGANRHCKARDGGRASGRRAEDGLRMGLRLWLGPFENMTSQYANDGANLYDSREDEMVHDQQRQQDWACHIFQA